MKSRRDTELLLLLAAAPAVVVLFALVKGSAGGTVTVSDLIVPLGLFACFLAAHVAARFMARGADPALMPIAFLLTGIGLATITRLDPELARSQMLWVLAGIAALIITLAVVPSLERLGRYKYTIALAGIVLLLLPALVGVEVNGAKLWLRFGGFSFQPAEVAKILIVVFLGAYLAEKREVLSVATTRVLGVWLPPAKHLGPLLMMWAVSLIVLVAEKDLGSSLLFFGTFLVMLYAGTGRPAYVLTGLGLFAVGASAAYMMFAHVQQRFAIWIDPSPTPRARLPARAVAVRARRRRRHRTGHRPWPARSHPIRGDRLHLHRRGRRTRFARRRGPDHRVSGLLHARAGHRHPRAL